MGFNSALKGYLEDWFSSRKTCLHKEQLHNKLRRPKVIIRADSHYTLRFRSVAERHRSVKIFSCVIYTEMFKLTGTSPSRLSSVPSPLLTENV